MARYFDVHPDNPQPRAIAQVAEIVRGGGLLAYPTDSGYALGCRLGNREGLERIRALRGLTERHHFTLVCSEFAQLGQYVQMDNDVFRAVKAATPGPYTFILKATREAPKVMLHPRKKTVGVRIPRHTTTLALLRELGEPLMSSTLILPGEEDPMTQGWLVKEELDASLDAVLDSGDCGLEPTTIVEFSDEGVEILRVGAGDPRCLSGVRSLSIEGGCAGDGRGRVAGDRLGWRARGDAGCDDRRGVCGRISYQHPEALGWGEGGEDHLLRGPGGHKVL